jgi:bifunctional DNase/RNase
VILEVVISDLKEGVFYSRIVCSDGTATFDIDARPSDAIAIGLRFGVPIFTVENVLSEAGIILSDLDEGDTENDEEDEDDEDEDDDSGSRAAKASKTPEARDPSGQVSSEELTKMLTQALGKRRLRESRQNPRRAQQAQRLITNSSEFDGLHELCFHKQKRCS